MHTKKKAQWKILLAGLAAAATLAAPITVTTAHAADAVVISEQASPAPIQVSGTVEQYYTDRSGYVTALDLNSTTGGVHKVRFAPSWADRLLENHPVGSTLDAWVVQDNSADMPLSNLVDIGAERPNRFLTNEFHTGTERLQSRAWVWRDAAHERVTGELDKVIVSERGEVLAIVLEDGTLVRVPRGVKHHEQGARGTKHVAQLFSGVEVTAWGPQVWHARGDVSIYGQRVASNGLSINGKSVGAIGIQNIDPNSSLLGGVFVMTEGADGEFSAFDPSMARQSPPPTMMSSTDSDSCGCG